MAVEILGLVHTITEFESQIWCNSVHVNKLDTQLNSVMRTISGSVKSTPLQWLSVMANIKPPKIRRKEALVKIIEKAEHLKRSLLYQMLLRTPEKRLKSRSPPDETSRKMISSRYNSAEDWRKEWSSFSTPNGKLVPDSNESQEWNFLVAPGLHYTDFE